MPEQSTDVLPESFGSRLTAQAVDCLSPRLKHAVDWWFDQSTGRRCRVLERVSYRVLTKGIDGGDWLDILWMDRIVLRDLKRVSWGNLGLYAVRGHQGAPRGAAGAVRGLRDGAGRRGGGNAMVMVGGSSGQWLAAIGMLERSHKVSAVAMSAARSRVPSTL